MGVFAAHLWGERHHHRLGADQAAGQVQVALHGVGMHLQAR